MGKKLLIFLIVLSLSFIDYSTYANTWDLELNSAEQNSETISDLKDNIKVLNNEKDWLDDKLILLKEEKELRDFFIKDLNFWEIEQIKYIISNYRTENIKLNSELAQKSKELEDISETRKKIIARRIQFYKDLIIYIDKYKRFEWGVPPISKGDYAFVLHMLYSLAENGRMGVVLPHGVLFRGASEGRIREQIINFNFLDAVIGLPQNLFFGTGIPACILIFKKNRSRKDILFVDASGEGNYEKGKNQNILREQDLQKIVEAYDRYETVNKYSYVATIEEIKENEYNLNIPRYVDTFEEEEEINIADVQTEIEVIEKELVVVQAQMKAYLKELEII